MESRMSYMLLMMANMEKEAATIWRKDFWKVEYKKKKEEDHKYWTLKDSSFNCIKIAKDIENDSTIHHQAPVVTGPHL